MGAWGNKWVTRGGPRGTRETPEWDLEKKKGTLGRQMGDQRGTWEDKRDNREEPDGTWRKDLLRHDAVVVAEATVSLRVV